MNETARIILSTIVTVSVFVTSDEGAQYIYLLLAINHVLLACDRHIERVFLAPGASFKRPLLGLEIGNWLSFIVFLLLMATLGKDQSIPRNDIIPYIRVVWLSIGVQLTIVSLIKSFRLLLAWYTKDYHIPGP